ncbi:pilus assembly protein PilL [Pseudomonas sp. GZD-209]|uniref:PFGI-1 class ICE element type IV pilus protein PilL2 n=1 Tax=Pseudomonas sp. GZD-209 TaxID=3404807 RepID=UPI003BB7D7DC
MIRQLTTLSLVALVTACAIQKAEQPPKPAFDSSRNPEWLAPDLYPNGASAEKEPVVRYSRYTLVSTQPDASQRDLMAQIIDVTIPSNMTPSVRDAMLYVVDRSGYALCPPSSQHVIILYTRPLPAAQYKLDPMTLRNTLQVLAGPAWQVKVDEVNRQVCFVLRPGYRLPSPSAPANQLYADKSSAPPVSEVRSPSVTTLNLQPAPIQIGNVQSYVASSSTTTTASVGSSTSLTPATITCGFNMMLLPKLLDKENMLLMITLSISSKPLFKDFESNDSKVQTTEYDTKNVAPKVRLRSGETLILTGFDENGDDARKSGVGSASFFGLGGGRTRSTTHSALVVLVTPIALPDSL